MAKGCYFKPISGASDKLPDLINFGAGVGWANIDEAKFRDFNLTNPLQAATENALSLGGTQGNVSFTTAIDKRTIEVNGILVETSELTVLNARNAELSVPILEQSHQILSKAISFSDKEVIGENMINHKPRLCIQPNDFFANILWGFTRGQGGWFFILMRNVMVSEGYSVDAAPNTEMVLPVTFKPTANLKNPTAVPYEFFEISTLPTFMLKNGETDDIVISKASAGVPITINTPRVLAYPHAISTMDLTTYPEGVTGSWSITDPASGELTLSATVDTPLGKHIVTINGKGDDGEIDTISIPVTVTN